MNKVNIDENIFYVENAIDRNDLEIINNFYDKYKPSFVRSGSFYNLFDLEKLSELKYIMKKMEKIIDSVIDNTKYHAHFNNTVQFYNKDIAVGKWAIAPHADRFTEEDIVITDEDDYVKEEGHHDSINSAHVTHGFIYYFNDDYEGGEVVYINKNISFKPKSGILLVHSAFSEYTHGVTRVESGERRFVTGFIYENEWCLHKH